MILDIIYVVILLDNIKCYRSPENFLHAIIVKNIVESAKSIIQNRKVSVVTVTVVDGFKVARLPQQIGNNHNR